MRAKNLKILERITLEQLESALDRHTREKIKVDRWTAFSWSASRHQMLERCSRQYYLNYYGARRVREANNEIVSAIWWLKQVTSLKAWIGTVIHHVARMAVEAHRDGKRISSGRLAETATQYYRDGVSASERGIKHDDQWVVLHEHIYPSEVFTLDHDAAEKQLVDLTHTLLESEAYGLISGTPPRDICEIDEPFQSFELPNVPALGTVRVFAIPDVLLYDGESIHIVDWKTGDVELASIRQQAGIYRLYAHHTYHLPEDAIHVSIADLGQRGESVKPPGGTPSIAEAAAFAHTSIAEMVARMEDVEYHTVPIRRFPMTDNLSFCQRCGFKRACWRYE